MDFREYQMIARKTAVYPNIDNNLIYPVLGLTNEAGEVAGKLKKVIRDNDGLLTDEARQAILDECGDVLWYLSQTCMELEANLDDVAKQNVSKLMDRYKRNVLKGSGDKR